MVHASGKPNGHCFRAKLFCRFIGYTECVSDTSTRSVDRTLDLLIYVCEQRTIADGCSLNDCAEHANLSPSTALRLLRTLMQRGFVERDEHSLFHPGTQITRIGANVLSDDNLIRLAKPVMDGIVRQVNESVYLLVRNYDGECLYIAVSQCTRSIQHVSWVGMTIPSQGSAAGRVLDGRIPTNGFVIMRGAVEPDVTSVSTAVRCGDNVIAAMSIVAPTYRVSDEIEQDFGSALVRGAQELSEQLG